MKLLLVEDEIELAYIVAKGLRKCNYAVDIAHDGQAALMNVEINDYDCIILDLNIPLIDGIDVLRKVREHDQTTKILILSARSEIEDRVLGLDEGANDYLIKPFDFLELEARIRTLSRITLVKQTSVLTYKQIQIDTQKKESTYWKQLLPLTKKEYGILEYLMIHQEEVISSEILVEHVWESDVDLFSNSLKFHIHSLKKKLNEISMEYSYIQNIRGQGYKLYEVKNETIS